MKRFIKIIVVFSILQNGTESKLKDLFKKLIHPYDDRVYLRVSNGIVAKQAEFPYQVAMKQPLGGKGWYVSFCGGTIVAPNKIISAAHCFYRKKTFIEKMCQVPIARTAVGAGKSFVVAGGLKNIVKYRKHDVGGFEQWRRIKRTIAAENYNFPESDITIVLLKKPFEYNANIGQVPYSTKSMDYTGLKCIASGFGNTETGERAEQLLWASVHIMSPSECTKRYDENTKHFICIYTDQNGVEPGDSGGPLVCFNTGEDEEGEKGILVGVACAKTSGVSLFTRVSSYPNFIKKNEAPKTESGFTLLIIVFILKYIFSSV